MSNIDIIEQWEKMYPRLEQLCRNRALSAGDIAEMLTEEFQLAVPLTRHAVIGKVYRSALSRPRGNKIKIAVLPPPPSLGTDPQEAHPSPPRGLSITELATRHCRWPSAGEGATMLYCGADRIVGTPYCRKHARMAYHGKK